MPKRTNNLDQSASTLQGKEVEYVSLDKLDFDSENPRFGRTAREARSQTEILNYIVNDFGVDDVLSSISVNGYFVAEPLICREQDSGDRLTVVEGNRRLAACLILAADPRAKHQTRRTENYQKLQFESKRPQLTTVPVIKFKRHEQEKDLLSYLGVRHIAASQGWDSYAKAAWVARVVENKDLTLKEVALMTGDQHATVRRLLEGYYFINQMIDEGHFIPDASQRKGRGSNPEFPFSWIYTLFGYPKARNFISLPSEPTENPIKQARVSEAKTLITALFGDKNLGRSAAIEDSRQIGGLAAILDNPEKTSLLSKGKSLAEIEFETQPIDIKLREGLSDCKAILSDIVASLEATPPSEGLASTILPLAKQVNNLSVALARKLFSAQQQPQSITDLDSSKNA